MTELAFGVQAQAEVAIQPHLLDEAQATAYFIVMEIVVPDP